MRPPEQSPRTAALAARNATTGPQRPCGTAAAPRRRPCDQTAVVRHRLRRPCGTAHAAPCDSDLHVMRTATGARARSMHEDYLPWLEFRAIELTVSVNALRVVQVKIPGPGTAGSDHATTAATICVGSHWARRKATTMRRRPCGTRCRSNHAAICGCAARCLPGNQSHCDAAVPATQRSGRASALL